MKLWGWMLAVVLASAGIAATPAAAQPDRVRVVERTRTYYGDDRGWRRDRYYRGDKWNGSGRKWANSPDKWDNSRRKWGWRSNCRTQWHNGRRDRVCRNVRYRRY